MSDDYPDLTARQIEERDFGHLAASHRDTSNGRAMGAHHSHRAGTTTWLTPPHIIDALGPFDLDPCGAPGWDTASETYILPTDGLALPWHGMVWLNPPYGAEAWTPRAS